MSVIEKAVAILRKEKPGEIPIRQKIGDRKHVNNNESGRSRNNLVCELDFNALRESGYLTNDSENTQFAEEYRLVKRPLLANAFGKGAISIENGNLVMITSSIPGEGKTFTSINLALSIALERDTTVLLVDIDVINPRLSTLFGLKEQPGINDVLGDASLNLGDVIINTDNPKLRLIPAGQYHEHSTEMLASDRMERICAELAERYSDRIIIFDAPPFLNTTQAKVLTRFMGQIMIVVEAGGTPKNAILETTSQIDKDKVVGMILNKCKVSKRNAYGGYYGSYGK